MWFGNPCIVESQEGLKQAHIEARLTSARGGVESQEGLKLLSDVVVFSVAYSVESQEGLKRFIKPPQRALIFVVAVESQEGLKRANYHHEVALPPPVVA